MYNTYNGSKPKQIRVASNNKLTKPGHIVASPAGQPRIIKPEGYITIQMHIIKYAHVNIDIDCKNNGYHIPSLYIQRTSSRTAK